MSASIWRPWRRLTQEDLTAQIQAELDQLPPYGTVPYHQHYIRSYVKSRRSQVAMAVLQMAALSTLGSEWYLRPMWGLLLLLSGSMIARLNASISEHRQKAWNVETQETLQGLSDSKMFDLIDAVAAMRDGPVPPGCKRKDWVRWHQEMLQDLAKGDG